jgi:hypothetical protein
VEERPRQLYPHACETHLYEGDEPPSAQNVTRGFCRPKSPVHKYTRSLDLVSNSVTERGTIDHKLLACAAGLCQLDLSWMHISALANSYKSDRTSQRSHNNIYTHSIIDILSTLLSVPKTRSDVGYCLAVVKSNRPSSGDWYQ